MVEAAQRLANDMSTLERAFPIGSEKWPPRPQLDGVALADSGRRSILASRWSTADECESWRCRSCSCGTRNRRPTGRCRPGRHGRDGRPRHPQGGGRRGGRVLGAAGGDRRPGRADRTPVAARRQPGVDRSLIRLAVWEMTSTDTPPKVVIARPSRWPRASAPRTAGVRQRRARRGDEGTTRPHGRMTDSQTRNPVDGPVIKPHGRTGHDHLGPPPRPRRPRYGRELGSGHRLGFGFWDLVIYPPTHGVFPQGPRLAQARGQEDGGGAQHRRPHAVRPGRADQRRVPDRDGGEVPPGRHGRAERPSGWWRPSATGGGWARSRTPTRPSGVVRDEMVQGWASADQRELRLADGGPTVILVAGINGAGKTTTIAKLCWLLKDQMKRQVMVAAADTFRAAAVDQLSVWAGRLGVDIVKHKQGPTRRRRLRRLRGGQVPRHRRADRRHGRPPAHAGQPDAGADQDPRRGRQADPRGAARGAAGVGRDTGQNAIRQAQEFSKAIHVTGLVLSKLTGRPRAAS